MRRPRRAGRHRPALCCAAWQLGRHHQPWLRHELYCPRGSTQWAPFVIRTETGCTGIFGADDDFWSRRHHQRPVQLLRRPTELHWPVRLGQQRQRDLRCQHLPSHTPAPVERTFTSLAPGRPFLRRRPVPASSAAPPPATRRWQCSSPTVRRRQPATCGRSATVTRAQRSARRTSTRAAGSYTVTLTVSSTGGATR